MNAQLLFLVIPHMSFPVFIRGLIIGKADAGNVFAVQNGEIGLLGDLAQLPVMIEEGRGDHNGEYSIRIFGFDFWFLSRGGLQQLVHAWDRIEDPILLSEITQKPYFSILNGENIASVRFAYDKATDDYWKRHMWDD